MFDHFFLSLKKKLIYKICGIDAATCKVGGHVAQNSLVIQHISALKKKFPGKRILVVPENQLGFFETRICELVDGIDNVYVIHQDGGTKPGVRKTAELTRRYVDTLIECFLQNCVKFDVTWFTLTDYTKKLSSAIANTVKPTDLIKASLRDELLRFRMNEDEVLTGKINGYTDDKAVAFMMFHYWGNVFLSANNDNPYIQYIPENALSKFALSSRYKNPHESLLYYSS